MNDFISLYELHWLSMKSPISRETTLVDISRAYESIININKESITHNESFDT